MPPYLTLKNFENNLDIGNIDKVGDPSPILLLIADQIYISVVIFHLTYHFSILVMKLQTTDSGLASYVAGLFDRSLSWKVR